MTIKKIALLLICATSLVSCGQPRYQNNNQSQSYQGGANNGQLAAWRQSNDGERIDLYTAACPYNEFKASYPYKVIVTQKNGTTKWGCFNANTAAQRVTIIMNGIKPVALPYSEFNEMPDPSANNGGVAAGVSRAINGFNQGLSDAQKYTQPPQSNIRNCRSTVNGNIVNTSCY